MNAKMSLDKGSMAYFKAALEDLHSITGREMKDLVAQQSKLTARDLIKSTPPNSNQPINESFNVQKKKGEQAITSDVDRLYKPLPSIKAITNASTPKDGARLRKLAQQGNWTEMANMLFAMKIFTRKPSIQEKADFDLQRKIRGSRGRISKNFKNPIWIWDDATIRLVKNKLLARVGWAKAGWMRAARGLGLTGVPAWITRHVSAPGDFKQVTDKQTASSYVEMENSVRYIAKLNDDGELLRRALRNRVRAMETACEKLAEKNFEKIL